MAIMQIKSLYMPDTCLQNEKFPAHILWDKKEKINIFIKVPENIELQEIFNVPEDSMSLIDNNTIKIENFNLNGYVGFVFQSKTHPDPKILSNIEFRLIDIKDGSDQIIKKEIELFRPSIKLGNVPSTIKIFYNEKTHAFELDQKIPIKNCGDGTAQIFVQLKQEGDFRKNLPSGLEEFENNFRKDFTGELNKIKAEFPDFTPLIDDFIEIVKTQKTYNTEERAKVKSIFKQLEESFENNEQFLFKFVSALSYSYLKNIQLITEIKSFLEYLNSIGNGRVILLNSIDILKTEKETGILELIIQNSDIMNNDYPPIEVTPIKINCVNKCGCEIPIHSLFDWKDDSNGVQR
jgi:hypothetical protein